VTSATQARKRIEQLSREIHEHDQRYYGEDRPTVSDAEYDRLFRELVALEEEHPDLRLPDSPTLRVGMAMRTAFRKVPHVAFKPDWTRHAKAAPFKRNDAMLEALPIGVIVFPGSGISENLADKARKMGIPVQRITERPAGH